MTGGGQHFIVAIDLHMLDIGVQSAPERINYRQRSRISLLKRRRITLCRRNNWALEALPRSARNRQSGAPARSVRHAAERLGCRPHHIALALPTSVRIAAPRSMPASSARSFSMARIGTAN